MNRTEETIQKQLTHEFISADPFEIILVRSVRVETPEGGYKMSTPTPLSPQLVRLMLPTDNDFSRAPDGAIVKSDVIVMGMPNLDIAAGDTFSRWGKTFKVTSVDDTPTYQKKAEAVRSG